MLKDLFSGSKDIVFCVLTAEDPWKCVCVYIESVLYFESDDVSLRC